MFKLLTDEERCSCTGAVAQDEVTIIAYLIIDSIIEKEYALKKYVERANIARGVGDTETADLLNHIAEEEDRHYYKLKDRLSGYKGKMSKRIES